MIFWIIQLILGDIGQNIDRSLFQYDIICDIYNNSKMKKAVTESIKFARIFSCRYQFSVLFLERKDIISPFDTLITDIKEEDLKNVISKKLNKQYLSPLSQSEKQVEQKRMGIIYGKSCRGLISIPTRYLNKNPIWIHYLVDTGSPSTYLTQEALRTLTSPSHQIIEKLQVNINGKQIAVDRSSHHFQDVNILGMDYLINRKSLFYHLLGKKTPNNYFEIEF